MFFITNNTRCLLEDTPEHILENTQKNMGHIGCPTMFFFRSTDKLSPRVPSLVTSGVPSFVTSGVPSLVTSGVPSLVTSGVPFLGTF